MPATALLVATLIAPFATGAEEITLHDQQAATLAINFCGGIVGKDPVGIQAKADSIAELKLSAPKPMLSSDESKNDSLRRALARGLGVKPGEPAHMAWFKSEDVNAYLVAFVRLDAATCVVASKGSPGTSAAVADRMNGSGTAWSEVMSMSETDRAWQQLDRDQKRLTLLMHSKGREITVISVFSDVGALPTLSAIDQFAKQFVWACVNPMLGDGKFDVTTFGPMFVVKERKPDGGILFGSGGSAPPSTLLVTSDKAVLACELDAGIRGLPSLPIRNAIEKAFKELNGAELTSPTGPDAEGKPRIWVLRDSSGAPRVEMTVAAPTEFARVEIHPARKP